LLGLGREADLAAAAAALVASLLSGLPARIVAPGEGDLCLSAGGILPGDLASGRIVVWGSGARHRPIGPELDIRATIGPLSRAVLGGPEMFGDPAWLMPWFHRPALPRCWELGWVLRPGQVAPTAVPDWVRVIAGDAPASAEQLRERIDEMLGCARVVSACAGALVLAETYGIATLPLVASRDGHGLKRLPTAADALGFAVADLYAGLRRAAVPAFLHAPDAPPQWDRLIAAIDQAWSPSWMREDDLIDAFPLACAPARLPEGASVFDPPPEAATREAASPEAAGHTAMAFDGGSAGALQAWVDAHGTVPLAWAATSEQIPYPNLGDALSAVIVSCMTGLPLQRRNFDDHGERLVAVGTIGHAQRNGIVHLWGTALDPRRNAFDASLGHFAVPPDTRLVVHATRGRNTAAKLREVGVACPDAYGDPVWFLPRLVGHRKVAPRWELGVILHITELEAATPEAGVLAAYRRYEIPAPLAGMVRVISTYTAQGTEALLDKIDEIRSCRRIVSTSFHGLVIPETFGIPNMWFSTHPGGAMLVDVDDMDVPMDHRVRDWYSGTSRRKVPIFGAQRHLPTRWDQVIRWLDQAWEPLVTDERGLFDAFPLRTSVSFEDSRWAMPPALFDDARY
jgi:hypothetical protein